MRHTIEIDSDVFQELGRRARPFVDTEPNDVLRVVLDLDEAPASAGSQGRSTPTRARRQLGRSRASDNGSDMARRPRAPKGSLLDERAYEVPILRALEEHGGRAAAREVVERVGELVDDDLMPLDREELATGGVRWQTHVQFARLRMKERGLLNPGAPRGVWEIAEQGRERLKQEIGTAAV